MIDYGSITDLAQSAIDVLVVQNFDSFKKPGQLKHVMAIDAVVQGTWRMSVLYNEADAAVATETLTISSDSRPDGLIGEDIVGTAFALHFEHDADEAAQVEMAIFYYDVLGLQ